MASRALQEERNHADLMLMKRGSFGAAYTTTLNTIEGLM